METRGKSAWLFLMLCACTGPREPFYDQPYEKQIEQAGRMQTADVYGLYKKAFDQPPPPLTHLSEVLGERGELVLDLWLDDLVNRGELANEWEFGPLLGELKRRSSLSLCSKPAKLKAAASALAKMRRAKEENMTKLLLQYC